MQFRDYVSHSPKLTPNKVRCPVQVKPRKTVVKDVSKKAGKSAGDPAGIFMGERESEKFSFKPDSFPTSFERRAKALCYLASCQNVG